LPPRRRASSITRPSLSPEDSSSRALRASPRPWTRQTRALRPREAAMESSCRSSDLVPPVVPTIEISLE
jgi:hypothetical protein